MVKIAKGLAQREALKKPYNGMLAQGIPYQSAFQLQSNVREG